MERKSVILVYWKGKRMYEAYSSLAAFLSHHPQYARYTIYDNRVDGVFTDHAVELRRVEFWPNRFKTRRGGLPRWKPGPPRKGTMKPRSRPR